MSDRIIASAIDDNYVVPLLLMAHSAKKHSLVTFKFIIGFSTPSLSETNRIFLSDVLNILEIDFEFREIVIDIHSVYDDYLTEITYARLYFADEMESDFLWVDADIILRNGWDEVFRIGFSKPSSFVLMASKDPITLDTSALKETRNTAVKRAGSNYFNAGFIYIDIHEWQNLGFQQTWKILQSKYSYLGFQYQDQCVLNYLLFGNVLILGNEFNQLVKQGVRIQSNQPKVLHYSGGDKPWKHTFFNLLFYSDTSLKKYQKIYIYNVLSFHFLLFLSSPKISHKSWKLLRSLNLDWTLSAFLKITIKKVARRI